jgi:NitT/TauT family transport system ATP-binding protein
VSVIEQTTAGAAQSAPCVAKIAARGVGRTFGAGRAAVHALGPLDLEVQAGEFVCLVGPSGCGKSTLLRILAGLAPPSEGCVEIATADGGPPRLAMVFQDYGIFPWMTVDANVRFGLDVVRVRRRDGRRQAQRWIDRLGLGAFAKAYPATLSGGMRQRVSIARALATDPEILLMDEPFAALDAQLRTLLQEELLQLCQESTRTVIFVTHSLDEALLLGDRVAVMSARPGRILEIVDVPFQRPRTPEIRSTPAFADLQQTLWNHLRNEVRRSMEPIEERV